MQAVVLGVGALGRIFLAVSLAVSVARAANFPTDRGDYAAGFPTHFSSGRSDIAMLANGPAAPWTVSVGSNQVGDAGYISFAGSSLRLIATASASTATSVSITSRCRTRIVANWASGAMANLTGTRHARYRVRDEQGRIERDVLLATTTGVQNASGILNEEILLGHSIEFVSETQGGSAALDLWNFTIREEDDILPARTTTITNNDGMLTLALSTDRRNNVYVLEQSSDLATWTLAPNGTRLAGNNSNTLSWSHTLVSPAQRVFFRVRLANN